jgi:hypothetical protein
MSNDYQVKIEVDNGFVVCNVKDGKVKGGNVEGQGGDTVHFIGNGVQFALAFVNFPDGGAAWPFVEDPPQSWPVPELKRTIKPVQKQPSFFKYSVSVAGAPTLDPIIIVDK